MKKTLSLIVTMLFFLSLHSTAYTQGPSAKTPAGGSQGMATTNAIPNPSKAFDRQTNTYTVGNVQTNSNGNSVTTANDSSNINVKGMDKEQVKGLDPSAMAGFDKEQMSNFDPSVMMAFDKEKVMNLDPSAMMGLAKHQIVRMDQDALSGLNKTQANNLTVESKVGVADTVMTFKDFSLEVRKVIAEEPIRRLGGVGSFEDLAQMIASKASNEMLANKGWDAKKMSVKMLEDRKDSVVSSQIPDARQGIVVNNLSGLFD